MTKGDYTIQQLAGTDTIPFNLLLLADETREAIEKYIYQSSIYCLYSLEVPEPIAVFALYKINDKTVEIKNIAVAESYQGKGLGSFLITAINTIAAMERYKEIIVGTADAGTREIHFYERNGFKRYGTRDNFYTDNYPEPIIENGIRLKDMIMLKIVL